MVDISTALQLCAAAADPSQLPSGWALTAWGVGDLNGNQAIVAQQTGTSQVAVAVRGTVVTNIWNWLMDFDVFHQVAFTGISGALISKGAYDGLQNLTAMTGRNGMTLPKYLASLAGDTSLLVTGHSLGGNLASVLAPWIAMNIDNLSANLSVMTFAAPTAGNAAFADYFNGMKSQAYFNSNDVVPQAWANLAYIKTLFPSPGPSAPDAVQRAVDALLAALERANVSYTQTAGTSGAATPESTTDWGTEVGFEHSIATYMSLFGPDAARR
jgi:triacylglycerol lipase